MGFIYPFILIGKQIQQQTCRDSARWDNSLSENLSEKWQSWQNDLQSLATIIIVNRCLTAQDFGDVKSTEPNHFSDASTLEHGQCSYNRFTNAENKVHCALLCGELRVAPWKAIAIPRELRAAVLSAKMAETHKPYQRSVLDRLRSCSRVHKQ